MLTNDKKIYCLEKAIESSCAMLNGSATILKGHKDYINSRKILEGRNNLLQIIKEIKKD